MGRVALNERKKPMNDNEDLNDPALQNYGNGEPFLPWENARYTAIFAGLFRRNGYKGKAWLTKWVVLSSSTPSVLVGGTYVYRIAIGAPGAKGDVDASKLRMVLAALEGADPSSATFDANAAREKWREKGELAVAESIQCEISSTVKQTLKGSPVTDYYVRRCS
jgi:hypothetical protein